MARSRASKSAAVRARLDHPVIDGDGHWLEPIPIFLDYLQRRRRRRRRRQVRRQGQGHHLVRSGARRADAPPPAPADLVGEPAGTLDRATAMIPRLFYERLDDFGIDFCVLYTSLGLFFVGNPTRRSAARLARGEPHERRAVRALSAPHHAGRRGARAHAQEAIEEATYAVRELGLKVVMIANHVRRPVPARPRGGPAQRGAHVRRLARLRERLRLRPVLAALRRPEGRGHRALRQHGHPLARVGVELHLQPHRSLRQRQPRLRQGADPGRRHPPLPPATLRHAGGRRGLGLQPRDRPRRPLGAAAARGHGGADLSDQPRPRRAGPALPRVRRRALRGQAERASVCINLAEPFTSAEEATERAYRQARFDDFAEVPVQPGEELRQHFAERFFFGCEADDPMTAWAFDRHGHHRSTRSSAPTSATSTSSTCRGPEEAWAGRARPHHRRRLRRSSSPTPPACTRP